MWGKINGWLKFANALRRDGETVLPPSHTRVLLACLTARSPTGMIQIRKVSAACGYSNGNTNAVWGILKKLAEHGFLKAVSIPSRCGKDSRTRYILNCSATIYRSAK